MVRTVADTIMKTTFNQTTTFLLATVLLLLSLNVGRVEASDRPNILFILGDDLGYGDVGCYNEESEIPTPNLDRLAAQGMRFTDAHSPCTVCTPTRYSLMTGQMAFRVLWQAYFSAADSAPEFPTKI